MDKRTFPTTEPNQRGTKKRTAGMSTQQGLILFLIGILNVVLLSLGAYVLLSLRAPTTMGQVQQPGNVPPAVSVMPPTWTPEPSPTSLQATAGGPENLLPACVPPDSSTVHGTVNRVIDRQTLEVTVDGLIQQIGFSGIQFPDLANAPGDLAVMTIQHIAALTEGKRVILVQVGSVPDASGISARYVFSGGLFINAELARLGMAVTDPSSTGLPCAGEIQQAEQAARSARTGVWQPGPVPTSTFIPFVTVAPAACDCSIRYECSAFRTHDEAQTCFNACNDYNSKLDEDHDGLACENLP